MKIPALKTVISEMVKSKSPITRTLIAMSGQENVITIYRSFVEFTGSYEGAALLSQLLYWTPKSKMGGWIAKTDAEFTHELCITQHGLRRARCLAAGRRGARVGHVSIRARHGWHGVRLPFHTAGDDRLGALSAGVRPVAVPVPVPRSPLGGGTGNGWYGIGNGSGTAGTALVL